MISIHFDYSFGDDQTFRQTKRLAILFEKEIDIIYNTFVIRKIYKKKQEQKWKKFLIH